MHKPSLAQIVHSATFPRPRTSDPATFSAHITRNLVPEVRIETSTFYGSLESTEAQYPGLDYSYGPHRMRLSRFPWHRRLFRVFDELCLTEAEISSLCRWEGTKSARQRYEKEEGVKVRDTTGDGIRPATPSPLPSIEVHFEDGPERVKEQEPEIEIHKDVVRSTTATASTSSSPSSTTTITTADTTSDRDVECEIQQAKAEEDSSDDEMESCGVELNHRLLAASAARERGSNVPLDEDWEQWLKEARERGSYTDVLHAIRTGQPLNFLYDVPSPPIPHGSRTGGRRSASLSEQFLLSSTPSRVLSTSASIRRPTQSPSGTAR